MNGKVLVGVFTVIGVYVTEKGSYAIHLRMGDGTVVNMFQASPPTAAVIDGEFTVTSETPKTIEVEKDGVKSKKDVVDRVGVFSKINEAIKGLTI